MSTAARIEELLGKFGENPRRYFAPLANEYRKAGDLAQAIALCREHLPKQPGHMSGHIVFGQALFESGEIDEAQQVFEAALALDPENLIALRHLGDIARQRGDAVSARRWYGRVLDADPRNDDIAALIDSLQFRATPSAPVTAIAADPTAPAPVETSAASYIDEPAWHTPAFLGRSGGVEPPAFETVPPSAPEPPTVELLDLDVPGDASETDAVIAATETLEAFEPTGADAVAPTEAIDAALDAFAAHDPLDDADQFMIDVETSAWSSASAEQPVITEDATPAAEAALALDAVVADADVDATLAFEEGLLADEWPSTDAFASRASTPVASIEPVVEVEATADAPALIEVADESVASWEAATRTSEVDAIADFDFDEIESAGAERVAETAMAEAAVAEDLGDAVDRAISDDLPYTIEADAPADDVEEPAIFAATDEDPPVSAAEMSWLSVAEEEHEAVALSESSLFADAEVDDVATWSGSADESARDDDAVVLSAAELVADEPEPSEPVVESAPSPAFVTETMAELLVAQGFVPRAIEVYEELVRRRPYDVALVGRLAELQASINTPTLTPRHATPISATPLSATPISATPISATPISATPLSATPINVTPLGVAALSPTPRSVPLVAPAPRRTARDWFGALAARRVSRRTPMAVPTVETFVAAAAASATETVPEVVHYDTPADGLASLFGNASLPASDDVHAAQSLASAFGNGASTSDAGGLFDEMSAATSSDDAEAYAAPAPSAFDASAPAATGPDGDTDTFSFDRFFPDPARVAEPARDGATDGAAPASGDGSVSPTQELAQFATWLKGLSNS